MSTVAFTAQSLGAGETEELRAMLVRGFIVAAVIGAALIVLQIPLAAHAARRDGRQRRRNPRRQDLFRDPDLVGAAGARQLCRARLADRTGARPAGARMQIAINLINMAATVLLVLVLDFGIAGAAIAAVIAEAAGLVARHPDRAPAVAVENSPSNARPCSTATS